MSKKLAIAMFGQKRLSREGGVEIVVKELCTRMAQNGCDVTCYNRAGHHVSGAEYDDAGKTEYEGIRQKSVPTIERRGLAAVSSSFFAALYSAFGRYDVVHIHAEGPAFFAWLPKMFGKRVVVLQVERDTENPDIRIVHQIKNSLAPTAEDIHFSISAEKGFQWMECRPQLIEKQQQDIELRFDSEQQKAVYWIKHFLEKGDMSANEIYCRLDNEGISKRVARMVKTEMGIHCYQKKRKWYWSVQPEEGVMNGPQV